MDNPFFTEKHMNHLQDCILVIDHNLETRNLISGQPVLSEGFEVLTAPTATDAFEVIEKYSPEIIIANLRLPDLSAKDVIIALSGQGIDIPVIVYAEKGEEEELLQAIQIGAAGCFQAPPRPGEFALVLDQAFTLVRSRKEQAALIRQLEQASARVAQTRRDINLIHAISKVLPSVSDNSELFNKILEAAIYLTSADSGWLLIKANHQGEFQLAAVRNIPQSMIDQIAASWVDGLSELVIFSGKTLSVYGSQLDGSIISRCGQSAMICPIVVRKTISGLIIIASQKPRFFSTRHKELIEILAIISSLGLLNAENICNP